MAPVAADIVKAYYEKKQQHQQQNQTAGNSLPGTRPAALVATLEPN